MHLFINSHISPIATATEDTISEKLQEQELRQAELNHYVKMVISLIKIINKSQLFQLVFLIELYLFCCLSLAFAKITWRSTL